MIKPIDPNICPKCGNSATFLDVVDSEYTDQIVQEMQCSNCCITWEAVHRCTHLRNQQEMLDDD